MVRIRLVTDVTSQQTLLFGSLVLVRPRSFHPLVENRPRSLLQNNPSLDLCSSHRMVRPGHQVNMRISSLNSRDVSLSRMVTSRCSIKTFLVILRNLTPTCLSQWSPERLNSTQPQSQTPVLSWIHNQTAEHWATGNFLGYGGAVRFWALTVDNVGAGFTPSAYYVYTGVVLLLSQEVV